MSPANRPPDLMQRLPSFPPTPDVGSLYRREPRSLFSGHKHHPSADDYQLVLR